MLFAHDNIPWPLSMTSTFTTVFDEKTAPKQFLNEVNSVRNRLNLDLAAVWAAMSEFCSLMNAAAETGGTKMEEELFLHSMCSIMYTLLHQRFKKGSLDEAFRLGLLAFSSPIFVHWNRVELFDPQFTSAYRESLAGLTLEEHGITPQEHTWLLMVCALSMSHEPDGMAWLRPRLQRNMYLCKVLTWDGMRHLLSSFLWMGLVYNKPAEVMFDSIISP